jgi:quercetin dioxygenase-like cupin family protein
MAHIIDREELPHSETAYRFEGSLYGDADVSFFLSDRPPGKGPSLHTHPYDEVFVIQRHPEGQTHLHGWGRHRRGKGGTDSRRPAGTPHRFVNSGAERSRHVDIHTSGRMITTWLEE